MYNEHLSVIEVVHQTIVAEIANYNN